MESISQPRTPAPGKGTITRMTAKRRQPVSAASRLEAEGIDLPQVMHELEQLSEVNASRVVKLHERIATGEYELDSARIAAKLLAFEKALHD